jgi:hypothetical protein
MDQSQGSASSNFSVRLNITPVRTDEVDRVVLNHIGDESIGVVDLQRWGFSHITLRDSLARLLKANLIERRWIGNERYGRFLYNRKALNSPNHVDPEATA